MDGLRMLVASPAVMLGHVAADREHDAKDEPWLAVGVDLRLIPTAEGGRRTPVLLDEPLRYRPNWGLAGMTGLDQVGGPVLCSSAAQVAPGESARVVIIPLAEQSLPLWRQVHDGDELRMFEGPRVCGLARVQWTEKTRRPVPEADHARYRAWAASDGRWPEAT
jgi:hypothetical protein